MALAIVSVAGVATLAPLWAPSAAGPGLVSTRLEALVVGAFLLLLALTWLRHWPSAARDDAGIPASLRLLQAVGGLLALGSQDLLGMICGLMLFHVAALAEGEPRRHNLVSALVALPCLAMIYAGEGRLDIAGLNANLWQRGGPAPLLTYLGVGLITATLIAQLWLAAERALGQGQPELALLSLVLLRVRLFATGAWAWEWRWGLTAVAMACIVWGAWQGWRRRKRRDGLIALARMQVGFALAAVAVSESPTGLLAALLSIYTLSLGYATLAAAWQSQSFRDAASCADMPVGLVRRPPRAGVPLLVAMLSLAAVAPLPGFGSRYASILTQWQALSSAWGWVGLALAVLGALVYLPWIIPLVRRAEPGPTDAPALQCGPLAWALALLLILGGLGALAGPKLIGWLIA
jgi:NADH:ubiquinone oxidoreductase subunit 2 (subunit N)